MKKVKGGTFSPCRGITNTARNLNNMIFLHHFYHYHKWKLMKKVRQGGWHPLSAFVHIHNFLPTDWTVHARLCKREVQSGF